MKTVLRILGAVAACVGIFVSATMISSSRKMELPEKYVYVSSSSSAYHYDWSQNTGAEYLGGDAYNYIVEASLKAGYYNATATTKAVTGTAGTVLLFCSVFFLFFSLYSLQNCLTAAGQGRAAEAARKDAEEKEKQYQGMVLQHLQRIEEHISTEKPLPAEEKPEPEQDRPAEEKPEQELLTDE